MTPHIAGAPATVAERLSELFARTSLDGLMLIFPDYLAALPVFADAVLPVLRNRFRRGSRPEWTTTRAWRTIAP